MAKPEKSNRITWGEYKQGGRDERIYKLNFEAQKIAGEFHLYFGTIVELHLVENIPLDVLEPLLSSFTNLRRYRKKGEPKIVNHTIPEGIPFQDQVSLQKVTEAYRLLDGKVDILTVITDDVKKKAEKASLKSGLFDDLLSQAVAKYIKSKKV